jgi:protein MpaA
MEFKELKSGLSVEGTDIKAYQSGTGKSYFYLMGGVHGDEPEGVYVTQQLFDWLKEQEIDCPMIVIPILNVDGHRLGSRVNANGVDLNRNLPSDGWKAEFKQDKYNPGSEPLSEPENRYMDQLFKKFPPHLIVTMHSWKPLLNYNGECLHVAEFLADYNQYPVSDDVSYPTPGSLGEYAPATYHSPVLTYELPPIDDDLSLSAIWQENEKGLKALLLSDLIKT